MNIHDIKNEHIFNNKIIHLVNSPPTINSYHINSPTPTITLYNELTPTIISNRINSHYKLISQTHIIHSLIHTINSYNKLTSHAFSLCSSRLRSLARINRPTYGPTSVPSFIHPTVKTPTWAAGRDDQDIRTSGGVGERQDAEN